ncbi:hypothetical protein [Jiella sp. M17.18]|uniref:hypothetical protein n=1 Tax=Jiella sp. M17.18 TaxID=3234247 RepID=UPI0034DED63F
MVMTSGWALSVEKGPKVRVAASAPADWPSMSAAKTQKSIKSLKPFTRTPPFSREAQWSMVHRAVAMANVKRLVDHDRGPISSDTLIDRLGQARPVS